ncbi:MAG TPA: glycogen synthase [Chthonomonadales bacterium]|nr:glycogen synthase [Chthonomonadales bacterium]
MPVNPLKILYLAAEVSPFAKVGGLADVAYALPRALRSLGHDVRVAMPSYGMVESGQYAGAKAIIDDLPVAIRPGLVESAYVRRTTLPSPEDTLQRSRRGPEGHTEDDPGRVPVYLIGNRREGDGSGYFTRGTESSKLYLAEPEPYIFFCRAALEFLPRLAPAWRPDVLHCNDWHSGLTPVYARLPAGIAAGVSSAATVYTIHNLAYQGVFETSRWSSTGIPNCLLTVEGLEFYEKWSFMKGGLVFADRVNTVSTRYADEIQSPEYGCGLDGLLRYLHGEGRLSGILNGIDEVEYNPETDRRIAAHYNSEDMSGKACCKLRLQQELKLPVAADIPLVCMVSRLTDQKGLDLLRAAATRLLAQPVQLAILGTGDARHERYLRKLQTRYPDQVRVAIRFDTALAQRLYAGSDMFLMPSHFEPCGLGQLIALRYGSIPIVRGTGGLAETITDVDRARGRCGNGFVFTEYSSEALARAVSRAVGWFQNRSRWQELVRQALITDYSWTGSAQKYVALYRDALTARQVRSGCA